MDPCQRNPCFFSGTSETKAGSDTSVWSEGFCSRFFPCTTALNSTFPFHILPPQIQLNLTIYLSHRHMCRQIGTTDSHKMQHPRKTTSCQRTGSCWNSSSHVGSDHHWSTRCSYLRLFTSDRSVLVPYLPEHSKAWTGGRWKQLLPFSPRCCRAKSCSAFQWNIAVTVGSPAQHRTSTIV